MLTEAESKRLAAFDALSGADQVRRTTYMIDCCEERALDGLIPGQLLQLARMWFASDWDFALQHWTDRQRFQALAGFPPRWDENEKPVYE